MDPDRMYLSYSGRKAYLTCPKQYEFRYITKPPISPDKTGSFFGSIIGKLFEWFYTNQLWAKSDPLAACLDLLPEAMQSVFSAEEYDPRSNPDFVRELRENLIKHVPIGIDIIRKYELLTPVSRAEEDLSCVYTPPDSDFSIKLGGRADFIHGKNKLDIWIVDGKGSKHREKYVDSEQLIWYAVQFYLRYHVAPTRLGFLFYQFPDDPIQWIAYDGNTMRASVATTVDVCKKIRLRMFDAKPSDECGNCDYRNLCDEGRKFFAKKKADSPGGRIDLDNCLFEMEQI